MYRAYFRKNDMDQPPLLDDDSSEDGEATSHSTAESKVKEQDENNLEARFYRFGVRPEFLQIQRILEHRCVFCVVVAIHFPCLTVNMVEFDTKDDKTEQGCYCVINWWC